MASFTYVCPSPYIIKLQLHRAPNPPNQDLSSVNRLMSKQETIESQMIVKQTQVQELHSQAQRLKTIEPEKEQVRRDDLQALLPLYAN